MVNKTLSLITTEEVFNLTIEALCHKGNWLQVGDLTLGDEGKLAFAKSVLLDMLGECIRNYKLNEAQSQIAVMQQQAQDLIAAGNAQARQAVIVALDGINIPEPEPPTPPDPEPTPPTVSVNLEVAPGSTFLGGSFTGADSITCEIRGSDSSVRQTTVQLSPDGTWTADISSEVFDSGVTYTAYVFATNSAGTTDNRDFSSF